MKQTNYQVMTSSARSSTERDFFLSKKRKKANQNYISTQIFTGIFRNFRVCIFFKCPQILTFRVKNIFNLGTMLTHPVTLPGSILNQFRKAWYFYSFMFCFILLTHEGAHREVYHDFQPSLTSGGDKCCLNHKFVHPSLHCPLANSASTQSQQPV